MLPWAVGLIAFGLIVLVGAPVLERALLYFPDPQRRAPQSFGLDDFSQHEVATADGTSRLVLWAHDAAPGERTLLYFHGNAGHLGNRAERLATFSAAGYGVVIMAYRGFSGSTGKPSETANVADAQTVYAWLTDRGVRPETIVLYGESLGTGVAVQLAVKRQVGALVLDAPYTAIVELGAKAYPYLPVRLLMRDRYETYKVIDKITRPMLIIHGDRDAIIPLEMGREIARLAGSNAQLEIIRGAGHSDHGQYGSIERVIDWVRAL